MDIHSKFSRLSKRYGYAEGSTSGFTGCSGGGGTLMQADGSTQYEYDYDSSCVRRIIPCPAEDVGDANGVGGVTVNPNSGQGADVGGLGTGFGWFAWKSETYAFWLSRVSSYGGRPFIDKAQLAGTRPTTIGLSLIHI